MLPIEFPEQNFVFTAPDGVETCGALPCWKGQTFNKEGGNSFPSIISCWQLSEDDIELIKVTGKVYLSVYGSTMPMVSISPLYPFRSLEELVK